MPLLPLSPVPSPTVARLTALAVLGQCTNCEATLPEPTPNFCPACGQETQIRPPKVAEFLQQFSGTYFASEGALWRTFKLLLSQPGELTAQYLNGRRKLYVLPLRLFLSMTVAMLLTMRLVGALQMSALDDPDLAAALAERPNEIALELGVVRAGMANGQFFCEGMPDWVCRRVRTKIDTSTAKLMEQVQKVNDRIASNAGVVMFVLLPAFAGMLALLFRHRGFSATEHLVFALHLHAFWFGAIALMMLALEWVPWLALLGLLVVPGYAALAFRRVYGGASGQLVWRCAVLTLVHTTLVICMVAITALAALLL
jgi:hypothetical protein